MCFSPEMRIPPIWDDFLYDNRDPDSVRDLTLYNLTVKVSDLYKAVEVAQA